MSMIGLVGLLVAFAGVAVSVVCLLASHVLGGTARKRGMGFFSQGPAERH